MKSGRHNDYFWIQWEDASLPMLLSRVPTIILGRYLINTSFDSGSLTLSDEERQSGWRSVESLTYSPCITDVAIPNDQFDEWLVFSKPTEIPSWKPLVNYHCFSLTDANYKGLQSELWEQLESVRPETYLADGDRLIFITSNLELFDLALAQNELDTTPA